MTFDMTSEPGVAGSGGPPGLGISGQQQQKQSPMQRSSPALFPSPTFCPSKKRSFLRREPHVADDNDDTQQLLLAACREGGCGHRHHSYTSNDPHSIFNNNNHLASLGQGSGSSAQTRAPNHTALQDRTSQRTRSSSSQESPSPFSGLRQLSNQLHLSSQPPPPPPQPPKPLKHQKRGPQKQKPSQKDARPGGQQQQQQQHVPQAKELVTMRQCSAPTPLYPSVGPGHALETIHQQHSFPEWNRSHKVQPLFQHSTARPQPPLVAASASAAAAAAVAAALPSPSCTLREDLCRSGSANANVLLTQEGRERHSNGNSVVGLGQESGGWMVPGQGKASPPFFNNNATSSPAPTVIAADDDMDSQGQSHTPDSPFRSDEGMGEEEEEEEEEDEEEEEEEDDDDEDDAMLGGAEFAANRVLRGLPLPPPLSPHSSPIPRGLPRPLQPLPSPCQPLPPAATDTSPSEIDDGEGCGESSGRKGTGGGGGCGGAGGGDGNSTSAGGVSLSDDASILSLSDPNLARSSPSTDCQPLRPDLGAGHSLASGDPHLEGDLYYGPSPDPDLSHSLSVYETAQSRTSSSSCDLLPAVPAFPADPHPHPHPHHPHPHHLRAAEGEGVGEGGVRVSAGTSPEDLLYPDASG